MRKTKITEAQFSLFKKECAKWINIFGLKNWELRYFLDGGDKKSYAWVNYNHDNRVADLYLTNDWAELNILPTNEQIKHTAFHEVMEIFLYPLRYLAEARYVLGWETIDCAIHDIIRTLETVVFYQKK